MTSAVRSRLADAPAPAATPQPSNPDAAGAGRSRKIKKGHTLAVALEIVKRTPRVNPLLLEEMEKIVAAYKGRDDIFDAHQDSKRIERQRTLFAMLPDMRATDALKQAMLDRAWYLLDIGECAACDALLEFVPSKDADAMLDQYFKDESAA